MEYFSPHWLKGVDNPSYSVSIIFSRVYYIYFMYLLRNNLHVIKCLVFGVQFHTFDKQRDSCSQHVYLIMLISITPKSSLTQLALSPKIGKHDSDSCYFGVASLTHTVYILFSFSLCPSENCFYIYYVVVCTAVLRFSLSWSTVSLCRHTVTCLRAVGPKCTWTASHLAVLWTKWPGAF